MRLFGELNAQLVLLFATQLCLNLINATGDSYLYAALALFLVLGLCVCAAHGFYEKAIDLAVSSSPVRANLAEALLQIGVLALLQLVQQAVPSSRLLYYVQFYVYESVLVLGVWRQSKSVERSEVRSRLFCVAPSLSLVALYSLGAREYALLRDALIVSSLLLQLLRLADHFAEHRESGTLDLAWLRRFLQLFAQIGDSRARIRLMGALQSHQSRCKDPTCPCHPDPGNRAYLK